ncbi:MAG: sulfatase-like hydrolase/transferase [Flavobacteriales bacterium]|nr:sulfatase-like hydrolase/transferase [Flavobacteriales bacterium]
MSRFLKVFILLIFIFSTTSVSAQTKSQKKNILFIAIDDMKPILGAYGDDFAISPNIDKLANQGVVFNNNHCQFAVCGPSRASLFSGQRPDQTQIVDLHTLIRDKRPNVTTLPQHFKNSGYTTYGVGKIYDPRSVDKGHDKVSWSKFILPGRLKYHEGFGKPELSYYQNPETKATITKLRKEAESKGITDGNKQYHYIAKRCKPAYEKADVPDDAYIDGAIVNSGIELLKEAAKSDKPFFLAVGFKRPHLPFVAPTKYWDMYDESKVPMAAFQQKVKGGVDVAYHNSPELGSYQIPGYTYKLVDGVVELPEQQQRKLIHGYYAATSYVDAQVGKLMAELKKQGLDKNTIVILWGDHGWHLGDHKLWNKHSNFEQATRSPMIIIDPSIGKEVKVNSPTEFVDIYPTLCDLAGIEAPRNLAGVSLRPLIDGSKTKVKEYAASEMTRGNPAGSIIGYSIRTDRYRYTAWVKGSPMKAKNLILKNIVGEELYDYKKDPLETVNFANDAEYKDVLKDLKLKFRYFFNNERAAAGDVVASNWRKEAEERIEKYRKGNVELTILDNNGNPFVGDVKIEQVSHDFRFGGIINSSLFVGSKNKVYKRAFASAFEHAGFENAYKIKHKVRATERTPEIIKWLNSENISLRGHALIWEKDKFMTNSLKKHLAKKDTLKVMKEMEDYLVYASTFYNVREWDVVNEPRDNHDLNDLTNQNTFVYWYNTADKYRRNKNVKFFYNENKVVSAPYKIAEKNIYTYYNHIKDIVDAGAPIDAIGFQSRFRQRITPEEIYRRICIFEDFNLPMLGTEFEIIDNNIQTFTDDERAEFTEEVMTVFFSHPKMLGLYFWTPFSDINKALFDMNGKPYKNGKVWLDKINEWTTNVSTKTDKDGKASFRGFKGEYRITATVKGKEKYKYITVLETDNIASIKL